MKKCGAIYESAVLKVENNKLKVNVVGSDWYLNQLSENKNEAVAYLKSLPAAHSETEAYAIPECFELTEEKIKSCDYIFTMKPSPLLKASLRSKKDYKLYN